MAVLVVDLAIAFVAAWGFLVAGAAVVLCVADVVKGRYGR